MTSSGEPHATRDETAAKTLVAAMDGLPLALDQAGAYIEETHCSIVDFLHLFETYPVALLQERYAHADHPFSVVKTFTLSFEQVQQKHPEAADLLRFCCMLAPDEIPEALFTENASHLNPLLQSVASNPLKWNAMLKALLGYALIARNARTKTITIHRLVQAVIRETMESQAQQQWAKRAVKVVDHVFPDTDADEDIASWSQCQRYLPHVEVCASLLRRYQLLLPETGHLLNQAGRYLRIRGQYKQSEALLKHALIINEQVLTPQHPQIADTLNSLAILYEAQGR